MLKGHNHQSVKCWHSQVHHIKLWPGSPEAFHSSNKLQMNWMSQLVVLSLAFLVLFFLFLLLPLWLKTTFSFLSFLGFINEILLHLYCKQIFCIKSPNKQQKFWMVVYRIKRQILWEYQMLNTRSNILRLKV